MYFTSLERKADNQPALEAFAVGDFVGETAIFFDVFFYRETLQAGAYTLTSGDARYAVMLPSEATGKGMPDVIYGVQLDLATGGQ